MAPCCSQGEIQASLPAIQGLYLLHHCYCSLLMVSQDPPCRRGDTRGQHALASSRATLSLASPVRRASCLSSFLPVDQERAWDREQGKGVGGRSPQSQVPKLLASWPGWTTRGGKATSWRLPERRNDMALETNPGKELGPTFPASWRPAPEQERDGVLG